MMSGADNGARTGTRAQLAAVIVAVTSTLSIAHVTVTVLEH
jgi:hypothetical protein